jgi:heparanase 1
MTGKQGLVVKIIILLLPIILCKSAPKEPSVSGSPVESGNSYVSAVEIVTDQALTVVDQRFLSVAIDTHILQKHWECFNFSSERLFTLARGLHPAYLRIGGNDQDFLIYDGNFTHAQGMCTEELLENIEAGMDGIQTNQLRWNLVDKKGINFTITSEDLDKIHEISQKAGWDVVFGLNLLLRRDDGSWNSSNPLEVMRYAAKKGFNFAWELGNGKHLSRCL